MKYGIWFSLPSSPLDQSFLDDLGVRVFGDLEEFEGDFGLGYGLFAVAGVIECETQVEEGVGLGLEVADLARDEERLFMEGYRLPVALQGGVRGPHIAERAGFAAAVGDLARDGQ